MAALRIVAWLKPKAGKMDDLKALVGKMIDVTREREKGKGTDIYHFFLNDRADEFMVHEHYSDAEKFMIHAGNIGPFVGGLADIVDTIKVHAGGDISDELAAALRQFACKNGVPDPSNCTIYVSESSI